MSATTTETITQRRTVVAEKSENDDYERELASRGLLNSDYGFIKKIVGEQMVVSFAALTAVLLQIAHPGVGKGVGLQSIACGCNVSLELLGGDRLADVIYSHRQGNVSNLYRIEGCLSQNVTSETGGCRHRIVQYCSVSR